MNDAFRLPSALLDAIASTLIEHASSREPDQTLHNGVDVYLRRWYLQRSAEYGNVYVHNTLRSDYDSEHHDHPWDNLSLWLRGVGLEEVRTNEGDLEIVERPPGTLVYRRAEDAHRILIGEPTWTLFVTGPKMREWGFHHQNGWMHNADFFRLRGYA